MAPMVIQDSLDLSVFDDYQFIDDTDLAINFDEIASLEQSFSDFDNTKLLEDNGVSVEHPPMPQAVFVQPPSPDSDLIQLQELLPASPYLIQAASPGTYVESSPGTSVESTLSPYPSQEFSLDPDFLQPVQTDVSLVDPPSPGQLYTAVMVCPSQPSLIEPVVLPSAESSPSPVQVKVEASSPSSCSEAADAPKKRGRKRKYPEGAAPRRNRNRKIKVYEMGPLSDEKEEKKRKNAINAKQHRDKQKNERINLAQKLEEVTAERDYLLKQVEELKQRDAQLRQRLAHASIVLP